MRPEPGWCSVSTALPVDVAAAYLECERVTAAAARNFAWGIRLLPAPRRRALSAVYALARRIDDIGDSADPPDERSARLVAVRAEVAELEGAVARPADWPRHDPVLLAVAHAAATTGLPLAEFDRLLDGCQADVDGRGYATFDELAGYTRQVAGSIGRLSVAVFGSGRGPRPPRAAGPLADALGTALQLTNIVRDLHEDARGGRVYLPAEDLDRFGCTLALDDAGAFVDDPQALVALVEYEAVRAAEWFDVGTRLLPLLDRRSRACCAAMAGIYRELLTRMALFPRAVLTGRTTLPDTRKAAVAARSLLGSWRAPVRAAPSGAVS